ncbi:MAG: hypothetical protein WD738_15100 [Pirellulales bacterium]
MAGANRNQFASEKVDQSYAAAEAWTEHEHGAEAVSNQAQKLVNMAGSIELANEALKSTVDPLSGTQKKEVAKQLGYESFEALLAASMVMTLGDGSAWCLTRDRSGAWAAWNVCAIDLPHRFKT